MPRVVHRLVANAHASTDDATASSVPQTRTACGIVSARSAARTTANVARVTCKPCIATILGSAAARASQRAAAIAATEQAVADAIARGAAPAVFGARELTDAHHAIARRSLLGDDESLAQRKYSWPSAVVAIAAWVAFRDDGQPIRSTTAASRFARDPGEGGGSGSGRSANDRAVTALVDRLHGVGAAMLIAYPAERVFDMGVDELGGSADPIRLSAAAQVDLLVLSVAGVMRTEPRSGAKGLRVFRESRSHDGVAEHWLLTRGDALTGRHVALVRAAGLRAVSAHLRAIGELEPASQSDDDYMRASAGTGSTKEASVATIPGCDVMGWEAIAEVVKIGEDKCRSLSQRADDPLPVYRMRDVRGVGAKAAELSDWLERQRVEGSAARSKVA